MSLRRRRDSEKEVVVVRREKEVGSVEVWMRDEASSWESIETRSEREGRDE